LRYDVSSLSSRCTDWVAMWRGDGGGMVDEWQYRVWIVFALLVSHGVCAQVLMGYDV